MNADAAPRSDAVTRRPSVSLRVISEADAPVLSRLETANREHLLIGAPERSDEWMSVEGQRAAIRAVRAELDAGRCAPLVIVADGAVVGRLSLNGIVRGPLLSASLGYWVSAHACGRGIATAAVRLAIDAAFGPVGLHRLEASVQVGNQASLRVLEKCGFTAYGLAPRYLRLGGAWRDCVMLQLLDPADTAE